MFSFVVLLRFWCFRILNNIGILVFDFWISSVSLSDLFELLSCPLYSLWGLLICVVFLCGLVSNCKVYQLGQADFVCVFVVTTGVQSSMIFVHINAKGEDCKCMNFACTFGGFPFMLKTLFV